MEKRSAKRRRGDDGIDRLSELPQPILHHILSLLPQKDAVQTCVLSKSWRYLWHGRYNVEFSERCLKKETWPFLDKTLQRYHDQNLSIRQFIVDVEMPMLNSGSTLLLEKWIPKVITNMGVRLLTLKFYPRKFYGNYLFSVPLVVFQSEFLVELDLGGCSLNQIKSTDKVLCKHLRTLRLLDVYVEEETFQKIMSSCPLIENLDVETCHGLETIELNNAHNLKHFSCSYRTMYETSDEIESPCVLESIRISYSRIWFHLHQNTFFPHLKSLNLWWVELSQESFDNFSSNFPCLNELTLDCCYGLDDFHLTSCSIKRLIIKLGWKTIKALFDTPNILYFECSEIEYGSLPSIQFKTTTKFAWKSHISVGYKPSSKKDAKRWFRQLSELLQACSQSRISLDCIHQLYKNLHTDLHIEDSFGGSFKPAVVVDTLILSGYFLSSSVPSMLDSFLRISRPRYILMNQYASKARAKYKKENNRLAEFVCKLIPNPKETIAETGHCYIWLQDLEEVSIQVWERKAHEWHCVQGKNLPALPEKEDEQQIRFRLKWRDQLCKLT